METTSDEGVDLPSKAVELIADGIKLTVNADEENEFLGDHSMSDDDEEVLFFSTK